MDSTFQSRPDWDTWFISLAHLISLRSLDPSKNGCVVTDQERTILSVGYNSPPRGCDDEMIPLTRPEKYRYMEHAESNAIINAARSGVSLKNSIFYITSHPCHECIRKIINVGATRVIYVDRLCKCVDDDSKKAIDVMLKDQSIVFIKYTNIEQVTGTLQRCIDYTKEKNELNTNEFQKIESTPHNGNSILNDLFVKNKPLGL